MGEQSVRSQRPGRGAAGPAQSLQLSLQSTAQLDFNWHFAEFSLPFGFLLLPLCNEELPQISRQRDFYLLGELALDVIRRYWRKQFSADQKSTSLCWPDCRQLLQPPPPVPLAQITELRNGWISTCSEALSKCLFEPDRGVPTLSALIETIIWVGLLRTSPSGFLETSVMGIYNEASTSRKLGAPA